MQVLTSSRQLNRLLEAHRTKKRSIGFVPTMGYLHEGHLSLARLSRRQNDITVVSIYVNPLQFGPKEDFKRYPRNFRRDKALLEKEKIDFLFAPDPKHFYKSDFQTTVKVEALSAPLCGRSRPVHFRGVATVVAKLLNQVRPSVVYLGQKDYQQVRVIEKMVEDLDIPTKVSMAPIVREKDGLAMSSRNVYLDKDQRRQAAVLHKALKSFGKSVKKGERNTVVLKKALRETLKSANLARIDYAEIVDARTLGPVVKLKKGSRVAAALAVYFGKTRLIDNILVKV